jgi:hypothetical protein
VSLMSCGGGNLYNFRQILSPHIMLRNSYSCTKFLNLSSLEIIDRTMYVQLILHYGFYNLYDLITLMTNTGNLTEKT